MSNLTHDELARLRLKAKHGTLTPEEQRAYNDYVTERLSAVPSPPSGAVPPKKGKPKRNIDVIDVARKIAGVAVIVVALALLGPKLLGIGTDLFGDAMNFTTAVHDAADAQRTGNAHYVATSHEAGTIDFERSDVFVSGEYFIAIRSDAHYGILSITCGAYDASAPDKTNKYNTVPDYFDKRGGVGMAVVDAGSSQWTIRDNELRTVLEAHGLSYDTFCSNAAAFNLSESELADLTAQVASVITYGDIASYPVTEDTDFIYTQNGHPYQSDENMGEWAVFTMYPIHANYPDDFTLDGSVDGSQMFADAQPTSVVEQ
ncbi:hypothetical protein [Sharpea azabuensis]|uniref:hypothetical protein n=1 Tax=Sharpea azabuensis TaxID=322505 RepID=UPI003D007B01